MMVSTAPQPLKKLASGIGSTKAGKMSISTDQMQEGSNWVKPYLILSTTCLKSFWGKAAYISRSSLAVEYRTMKALQ
jgi:hypothetical protein